MGPSMDLMKWVDPDMMIKILTCLDDPSDLVRAGAVSRSWRHFVVENGLCKKLCLERLPQLSRVSSVVEINHNESEDQPPEIGSSSSNWMEWDRMVKEHRVYASLSQSSNSSELKNCILEAVSASSTDNYPEESIENTLDPRESFGRSTSYWSSKGQKDKRVPETLIYKLVSNLCVITEISIQPFQAFFQPNLPIYSAKAVRFRMGHAKYPMGFETDSMDESCDDDKFIWTYTSQEFQMDQIHCLQKFKLPEPVLFIGGYLQIELLGRIQRQETDYLYYICVSHVQILGHSLGPAFDAEIIDPSGKIVLKQNLNLDNSISNVPKDNSLSLSSTAGNLERRVRTLEQIVEILRGNEFVFGWPGPGDDESDDEDFAL